MPSQIIVQRCHRVSFSDSIVRRTDLSGDLTEASGVQTPALRFAPSPTTLGQSRYPSDSTTLDVMELF